MLNPKPQKCSDCRGKAELCINCYEPDCNCKDPKPEACRLCQGHGWRMVLTDRDSIHIALSMIVGEFLANPQCPGSARDPE